MAQDLSELLTRIGHKAELLTTRYATLVGELKRRKDEIAEKDARIMALTAECRQLQLQVEHLQLAANIAPSRKSLEESRAFVSNLVREIDACVDDLIRDI